MNIEQMLAVLNPEIVERLRTAVEIGKWPNGVALTPEQRQTCMQAVYAWEMKNLPEMSAAVISIAVLKKRLRNVMMIITKMNQNSSRFVLFKA